MVSANAMITGGGTDKDAYSPGDKVTTFITIKNTGSVAIKDINLNLSLAKYLPLFGTSNTYWTEFMMKGLDILPGEIRDVEVSEKIPEGFHGTPTKGKYALKIKVKVEDRDIGGMTKTITVR
jgi:uncharacterized membrane protein